MLNEDQILKALSNVIEPDLGKDLVTLKMIDKLIITDQKISFTIILTTPACPLKDKMKNDCIAEIKKMDDKIEIEVDFTSKVSNNRIDKADILKETKNIILVSSGKGGVGKSTVAANLALSLQRSGAKVGFLDADVYGPSASVIFGLEKEKPQMIDKNGKSLMVPVERFGIKIITIGLYVNPGQALIWRGPMASSTLKQFFTEVDWGELDYMVIDLPPGTGDIHLTIAQITKPTGAIVVTTPDTLSLSDARKGTSMFFNTSINIPVLGIVENMSWFEPLEEPGNKYHIFGKGAAQSIADEYSLDVLSQIPLVAKKDDENNVHLFLEEENHPLAATFKQLAGEVARRVSILNAEIAIS